MRVAIERRRSCKISCLHVSQLEMIPVFENKKGWLSMPFPKAKQNSGPYRSTRRVKKEGDGSDGTMDTLAGPARMVPSG